MTDSTNEKRPVRKLTVKNFSVIKEAELEFGKITVLIGPPSSGKSLLCKLSYFLGKELVEGAVTSVLQGTPWSDFVLAASRSFSSRYNSRQTLTSSSSLIEFSSHRYGVSLRWETSQADFPAIQFSKEFENTYWTLLQSYHAKPPSLSGALIPGGISAPTRREDVWITLNQMLTGSDLRGVFYIPAGRTFFTDPYKGIVAAQNAGIDTITRDFAGQLLWDDNWKSGLLTTGRGVTDEINRSMTEIVHGFVMIDSGSPRFLTSDGRKLNLDVLSTGVQELIPLFNIVEQLMYFGEHSSESVKAMKVPSREKVISKPFLFLEEPEANVFPLTQYELVKLFAWLANDLILSFDWVITTHSPYILSAFNNLIEASQVVAARPELKGEVSKLIPEQYWVKSSDFKAYCIRDGVLESIMDDETGLISANYLDSVSETIGVEFDELMRIGYVES